MPDDDDLRLVRLQEELKHRALLLDAKVVQDYAEQKAREVEALKRAGDLTGAITAAEAVRDRLRDYQQRPAATDPIAQATMELNRHHGPDRVALHVMLERAKEARAEAADPTARTRADQELARALELAQAARAGDERQQRRLQELALERAAFGFDRLELSVTAKAAGI